VGAAASVVVDGHIVGGGEGLEGGAIFENIIGNKGSTLRGTVMEFNKGQLMNALSPNDERERGKGD